MRLQLLSLLSLFVSLSVEAQTPPEGTPSVIPPTPTAAALEKYGQVPVGAYTGVPDIAVPLYEIKVRDLSLPISLNYHAGGFRVSEEASWVGLGWSLLAGGAITRTVRNLDDLGSYFINHYGNYTPSVFNMPDPTPGYEWALGADITGTSNNVNGNGFNHGNTYYGVMGVMHDLQTITVNTVPVVLGEAINDPTMDWEPDDFRFSAGSYSGQFAFKQDGTLHLLEQSKVKIDYSNASSSWKISTPDGFQYVYAAAESTTTVDANPLKRFAITAWYLTQITSPLGEKATLTYESGPDIQNRPALSQTEVKQAYGTCDAAGQTNQTAAFSLGSSSPQYLRRIDFQTGYVLFERGANRLDLEGGQRLSMIRIYDKQDHQLKQFALQASYFETPSNLQNGYATTNKSYETKRLRLDAVQESGSDGTTKPATTFQYNTTPLPVKSGYGVDFWGYYNGHDDNTTLIPSYSGPDLNGELTTFPGGANRTPDAAAMQACILSKISYPTGGSTTYTFEPHEYGNITAEDDQVISDRLNLQLQDDNTAPANSFVSPAFTVSAANTPFTINYAIRLFSSADPNLKSETAIYLIDESTKQPFYRASPTGGPYADSGIWTFPSNSTDLQVTGTATITLPPGTYHLQAFRPYCGTTSADCHVYMSATASYPVITRLQGSSAPNRLAGGLRIKRVEKFDGLDAQHNQVWTYEYDYHANNAAGQDTRYSYGVLVNRPVFKKVLHYAIASSEVAPCNSLQLTSYSNTCFSAAAKGSTVGYSQVNVLQGAHGEGGKTEYSFYCVADRPVEYENPVPNVPTRSDDLNGYLTQQATYRWAAEGYHLVSRTSSQYVSPSDKYKYDLPAMYRGSSWVYYNNHNKTYFYYYPIPVRWVRLQQTTTTTYDPADATKYLVTSTRYTYDTLDVGHRQVSQTRTRRSDGSTVLSTLTYPADYTAVADGPLAAMRSEDFYQHTAVVETQTRIYGPTQTLADAQTVAGSYTEYMQPTKSSRFLPVTKSTLDLTQPLSHLPSSAPSLPPPSRYVRKQKLFYEAVAANLQQLQKEHGLPTVYLWGYDNKLLVAQIEGATLQQVQTALGVEVNTLTTEQQLRAAFTRVRQQLPRAHITSFTYQPLVGLTSQTDPSGRTFFYEYDGLQRLIRTRDEQGRILSQQQYHYASAK